MAEDSPVLRAVDEDHRPHALHDRQDREDEIDIEEDRQHAGPERAEARALRGAQVAFLDQIIAVAPFADQITLLRIDGLGRIDGLPALGAGLHLDPALNGGGRRRGFGGRGGHRATLARAPLPVKPRLPPGPRKPPPFRPHYAWIAVPARGFSAPSPPLARPSPRRSPSLPLHGSSSVRVSMMPSQTSGGSMARSWWRCLATALMKAGSA